MGVIREMFSDNDGHLSSLRVMTMIALLAAVGLAYMGKDNSVLVFVGVAFGSKVAQKHVEVSGAKVDTDVEQRS